MTPVQIRMALAALQVDLEHLGRSSGLAPDVVTALESGATNPAAAAKLRATFEAQGLEFLDDDGVRLPAHRQGSVLSVPVEQLTTDNDE